MWWGYPPGGGWGMPFGMFLFPIFFLIFMGFMFFMFSRGRCPFGSHVYNDAQANKDLLEEVRKLRQELEELKRRKIQ